MRNGPHEEHVRVVNRPDARDVDGTVGREEVLRMVGHAPRVEDVRMLGTPCLVGRW